eukprot:gnl/TRDRNA2_/TRDRNA2_87073_c0_seq1.p1 gnl/TRDRNA2_/TRDRNA2_87073_c0~~gnl/TRDRNA2_/TRDRNA2_87073_c0_seq1.p1  ORF type:complete len:171 (+),score=32.02 gnl/TRDRNA2_/TRDRNA2_87073_c0_seq1:400-912(+)
MFFEKDSIVVELVPRALASDGTTRLAVWHGLVCVATPRAMLRAALLPAALLAESRGEQRASERPAIPSIGVYAVRVCYGSPAQAGELKAQVWILEVDGCPVRCLDDLPRAAPAAAGALGADLRVRMVDHCGRESMETLRPDDLFWPASELRRGEDGRWTRTVVRTAAASS